MPMPIAQALPGGGKMCFFAQLCSFATHRGPLPGMSALPRPWLLADIGGTNARFGWLAAASGSVAEVRTLKSADHGGPLAAARAYLDGLRGTLGSEAAAPRAAAFAVATAVTGDRVEFTNGGWVFSQADTERELGVSRLVVLNDFEALALSLPALRADQVRPIGAAGPAAVAPPRATRVVIGPGTGLGVAGLVPHRDGFIAVPGEGGHASLAACDDREAALLALVRREHRHVSAERLLSGIGLPVLHGALARLEGQAAPALAAEQIVERALAGHDVLAASTIDLFCALLGGFAGNVALTFGARGGVYIGGGIVPRLGERFFASQFRARFEAKGRFEGYQRAIPTLLITDTLAALAGAAVALDQGGA
jgi:glucokinase